MRNYFLGLSVGGGMFGGAFAEPPFIISVIFTSCSLRVSLRRVSCFSRTVERVLVSSIRSSNSSINSCF
jgi:hypothetical protein